MKVKKLRESLSKFPDEMEVMTKKTEVFGNIGYIFSVRKDSYGFFLEVIYHAYCLQMKMIFMILKMTKKVMKRNDYIH